MANPTKGKVDDATWDAFLTDLTALEQEYKEALNKAMSVTDRGSVQLANEMFGGDKDGRIQALFDEYGVPRRVGGRYIDIGALGAVTDRVKIKGDAPLGSYSHGTGTTLADSFQGNPLVNLALGATTGGVGNLLLNGLGSDSGGLGGMDALKFGYDMATYENPGSGWKPSEGGFSTTETLPPELEGNVQMGDIYGPGGMFDIAIMDYPGGGQIFKEEEGGKGSSASSAQETEEAPAEIEEPEQSSPTSIVGSIFGDDYDFGGILAPQQVDNVLNDQQVGIPGTEIKETVGPGDFRVQGGVVQQDTPNGWVTVDANRYEPYLGSNPADGGYYDDGTPYQEQVEQSGGEQTEEDVVASTPTPTPTQPRWDTSAYENEELVVGGGVTTGPYPTQRPEGVWGDPTAWYIKGGPTGLQEVWPDGKGGYTTTNPQGDAPEGNDTTGDTGSDGDTGGNDGDGNGKDDGDGDGRDGDGRAPQTGAPRPGGMIGGAGGESNDLFGYRTFLPNQAYQVNGLMDYVAALQNGRVL